MRHRMTWYVVMWLVLMLHLIFQCHSQEVHNNRVWDTGRGGGLQGLNLKIWLWIFYGIDMRNEGRWPQFSDFKFFVCLQLHVSSMLRMWQHFWWIECCAWCSLTLKGKVLPVLLVLWHQRTQFNVQISEEDEGCSSNRESHIQHSTRNDQKCGWAIVHQLQMVTWIPLIWWDIQTQKVSIARELRTTANLNQMHRKHNPLWGWTKG